jgi:hypothetical protein
LPLTGLIGGVGKIADMFWLWKVFGAVIWTIAVISPFPLHRIPHFFPGRKAAFKHHYLRRNLL